MMSKLKSFVKLFVPPIFVKLCKSPKVANFSEVQRLKKYCELADNGGGGKYFCVEYRCS